MNAPKEGLKVDVVAGFACGSVFHLVASVAHLGGFGSR